MNPAGAHRTHRSSIHPSVRGYSEESLASRSRQSGRARPSQGETTTGCPLTVNGLIDDFRKNRLDASRAWLRKLERQAANQPEASELLRVAKEAAQAYDEVLADLEKLRALLKKPAPEKDARSTSRVPLRSKDRAKVPYAPS